MKIILKVFIVTVIVFGIKNSAFFINTVNAGPIEPSPYLQFSDSPFNGTTFSYFHLEDFEDQALNTPGVTGTGNIASLFILPNQIDSVDEDDGFINGNNVNADSYFDGNVSSGPKSISFTFDETILGNLPSHVGLVWTDGLGNTTFEAFDSIGVSLGVIGPVAVSDANITGETAEDRFFGWINLGGISMISISDDATGIEVDHLQYGLVSSPSAVPEPTTVALLGIGLAGLAGAEVRRRRKKKVVYKS